MWNEQKLAYPINGHPKGTYWLTYFRISTDKLVGLNRQYQLNEAVLRHLVLAVDDRLVEPLVQHAIQGSKKEAPKADAAKPAPEAAAAE